MERGEIELLLQVHGQRARSVARYYVLSQAQLGSADEAFLREHATDLDVHALQSWLAKTPPQGGDEPPPERRQVLDILLERAKADEMEICAHLGRTREAFLPSELRYLESQLQSFATAPALRLAQRPPSIPPAQSDMPGDGLSGFLDDLDLSAAAGSLALPSNESATGQPPMSDQSWLGLAGDWPGSWLPGALARLENCSDLSERLLLVDWALGQGVESSRLWEKGLGPLLDNLHESAVTQWLCEKWQAEGSLGREMTRHLLLNGGFAGLGELVTMAVSQEFTSAAQVCERLSAGFGDLVKTGPSATIRRAAAAGLVCLGLGAERWHARDDESDTTLFALLECAHRRGTGGADGIQTAVAALYAYGDALAPAEAKALAATGGAIPLADRADPPVGENRRSAHCCRAPT